MRRLWAMSACVLVAVGLCGMAYAANLAQVGPVSGAVQLVPGTTVTLSQVLIDRCEGPWLFVRSPFAATSRISTIQVPVYADCSPTCTVGSSVTVTGRVFSASGKLFVWATSLRLLIDSRTGRPSFPMPYGWQWPYTRDIELNLLGPTDGLVPPNVDEFDQGVPAPSPVAESGTIAGAKTAAIVVTAQSVGHYTISSVPPQQTGGAVSLTGKPVAGVFYQPSSQYIDYLYIEEPDRTSGIKVIPESRTIEAWAVNAGDVVSVSGEVVDGASSGECYIGSATVTVTSTGAPPAPLCSPMRSVCGGVFGEQPALYLTPTVAGTGLSRVGTRVTVCGKCLSATTANGCTVLYLDDGSGLTRSNADGLKVVYYRPGDAPVNPVDQMITATGLLGAEKDGDNPVPVLRVPNARVICVRPDGSDANDGFTWSTAKYTIPDAIDTAYAAVPRCDVWVTAGTYCYCDSIYMRSGVSLYGGFIGDEAERHQRNWLLNPTIIQPSGGPACITAPTDTGGPVVIDGFNTAGSALANANGIVCDSIGVDVTICHNTTLGCSYGIEVYGSTGHQVKIVDNWASGTVVGVRCVDTDPSPVLIANNAIVDCADYGIYVSGSSPIVANNIIASNAVGVSDYGGGTSYPSLRYNCVYGNGMDFWLSEPLDEVGTVTGAPCLVGFHIGPASACVDSADDDSTAPGETDIDGQPRETPLDPAPDIGPDEYSVHDGETATITPGSVVAPSGTGTVVMNVFDEVTQDDVEGRRVDFSISAGQIASISPNGHLETATNGWGTTGSDGNITLTVTTPATAQKVVVAARARLATGRAARRSVLYPKQYKVGFLYDLAMWKTYIDDFLEQEAGNCQDVTYARIPSILPGIDSSFNTVFLSFPDIWSDPPPPILTQAEIAALVSFVASGREKRIVLVGEYNSDFADGNLWLNDVADRIGMEARFSTTGSWYDSDFAPCRPCAVNPDHYLTAGVKYLCDSATSCFVHSGQQSWNLWARPLAYVNGAPQEAWIVEEDTATAGSRVAIHDSTMMCEYAADWDTLPDKNFLFIHNLCTIFPQ